ELVGPAVLPRAARMIASLDVDPLHPAVEQQALAGGEVGDRRGHGVVGDARAHLTDRASPTPAHLGHEATTRRVRLPDDLGAVALDRLDLAHVPRVGALRVGDGVAAPEDP